ncbi:MAG: VWA domain-containing protein [Treponemataceae bacterium]
MKQSERYEMKSTRSILTAVLLGAALYAAPSLSAEVTIGQIDPSSLLTRQRVDIYLSPTDGDGRVISGLGSERFSLSEGTSEKDLSRVNGFELTEGVNAADGITFLLLVDNSGSMYDRIDGTPTTIDAETRMAAARRAVAAFLNSVDNPKDVIGLSSFNTNFIEGVPPTSVRSAVETAFSRVARPGRDDAYTELYVSLSETAHALEERKGRKVVILLSDGENYPYAAHSGKPHPLYGGKIAASSEAIDSLVAQGVSVFPVHFGSGQRDSALRQIASGTGGRVFNAQDEAQLADVYKEIRARVLREYRLRYRPAMLSGDRRVVRVEFRAETGDSSATQYYFTGTLFGSSAGSLNPLLLIPLLLAPALWFALTRLRLLNKRSEANLEVLDGGATQVFSLSDGRTVIGAVGGELTIAAAGNTAPNAGDVTVVKDARTGAYTVVSTKTVYVNNKPTENRLLSPGDVIRVGEATIVFDEPVEPIKVAEKKTKGR